MESHVTNKIYSSTSGVPVGPVTKSRVGVVDESLGMYKKKLQVLRKLGEGCLRSSFQSDNDRRSGKGQVLEVGNNGFVVS